MSVAVGERQLMLPAKGRDSDVIFRNGRHRFAKLLSDAGEVAGGVGIDRHQWALGFRLLNSSLQLGLLTRPPDAEKKLAERQYRKVPVLSAQQQ